MKSRISIDVDFDNHPVIKIEYVSSEDVRDKLVKKFLESLSHAGPPVMKLRYDATISHPNGLAIVRPLILLEEHRDLAKEIIEWTGRIKSDEDNLDRIISSL